MLRGQPRPYRRHRSTSQANSRETTLIRDASIPPGHAQESHQSRHASVRAANVLRRRSLWGCNRFVLARVQWKATHVRVQTFDNAVICLSAETSQEMERGERRIGRLTLAFYELAAVEAIQGDLGWSSFETGEARSEAAYKGRLRLMNEAPACVSGTMMCQPDAKGKTTTIIISKRTTFPHPDDALLYCVRPWYKVRSGMSDTLETRSQNFLDVPVVDDRKPWDVCRFQLDTVAKAVIPGTSPDRLR
ncbi:hypothetical protein HPB49_008040 [Dermacentor silvarum]|uniref:Uncharacterized protein n=1 Tax=Dermacentor silvarum TaxID=543639 RepID=A0ACB8DIQ0_DERSI|nr:hypothetical protein HPB49_008040 [Dermacentor silvarum]